MGRLPAARAALTVAPALVCWCAVAPAEASAQTALLTTRENFRAEADGTKLAEVMEGEELPVRGREGRWLRVELRGWIWSRSVRTTDRDGFDVVVGVDGGENLRAEPRGRIRARLLEGMLLDELGREPGWIEVRRSGWLWRPSVELREGEEGSGEAPEADPGEAPGDRERPAPSRSPESPDVPAEWLEVPDGGRPVLSAPDGDTLGVSIGGTALRVLDREGGWARVRLEGWVWSPPGGSEEGEDALEVLRDVTPAELAAEPDRYRGRLVEWSLRFISLERAERIRTDFYQGEPFMLTRGPGDRSGFIYVAVPPEKLPEAEALQSLAGITVVARVRTVASELTGNPILELLELRTAG